MVKIRFICTTLLLLITLYTPAQSLIRSVISVTGNTCFENNRGISYTVGEAVTGTFTAPDHGLTQGFQQPSPKSFFDQEASKLSINAVEVFPNPVINNLYLLFNTRYSLVLNADLFSARGETYLNAKYTITDSGSIIIEMEKCPAGLYVLHLYSKDKLVDRVFKIEKM